MLISSMQQLLWGRDDDADATITLQAMYSRPLLQGSPQVQRCDGRQVLRRMQPRQRDQGRSSQQPSLPRMELPPAMMTRSSL